MKPWIATIGMGLILLVSCSEGGIQANGTPTAEVAVEATKIQTSTPSVTPTEGNEANMIVPDLKAVPDGTVWNGNIQEANVVEKDGDAAIEFDKLDWNVIWLDGFEFNDGIIEFDAKGKSEPPQGSFIGVTFRVVDIDTYDAVYFRPFNFRASDETRRSHAVQYVSSPLWHWERLRTEKTGQYEMPIDPAPDGDEWFHAKVVIEGQQVSVFVNDAAEPALQVTALSDRTGGSVGIWCYGYGVIANLKITPTE